jgi:hypothetical protein
VLALEDEIEVGDLIVLCKGTLLLTVAFSDSLSSGIPHIDISVDRVLREDEAFLFAGLNHFNRYKTVLDNNRFLSVRPADFKKCIVLQKTARIVEK